MRFHKATAVYTSQLFGYVEDRAAEKRGGSLLITEATTARRWLIGCRQEHATPPSKTANPYPPVYPPTIPLEIRCISNSSTGFELIDPVLFMLYAIARYWSIDKRNSTLEYRSLSDRKHNR